MRRTLWMLSSTASVHFVIKDDSRIGRSMRTESVWPNLNILHRRRGGIGILVIWFVRTIMEYAMTPYEAALAELEKARRTSFLLKGLICDPASIAEFRTANDEVIRAAELCGALASKLAPANSQ
jgi:hypothetical protein